MKTLKTRFMYLPIALALLILFQGCTVYKKPSVTLQEAAQEQVKTKIKTKNGQFFFKYITFENDNFYGVKKSKGKLEKIRLDEESIKGIHLQNIAMSVIVTIILPLGIMIGAMMFAFRDGVI